MQRHGAKQAMRELEISLRAKVLRAIAGSVLVGSVRGFMIWGVMLLLNIDAAAGPGDPGGGYRALFDHHESKRVPPPHLGGVGLPCVVCYKKRCLRSPLSL
jgi:hypothetical protein